jgi:hypothetical protein
MTSRRVLLALWLAWAFVTWNVVFDRAVAVAGAEFTRDQIARHQKGEAVAFIEDAFSPRVGAAAVEASLYAAVILVTGAVVMLRKR